MTKKLTAADLDRLVNGRDDLQLAFSRCNETKTALQMNLRGAHKERDGLAAQNQALRDALKACLQCFAEMYGRKPGFVEDSIAMANEALALPDTSAEILRARDARVLRDAAERLESHDFVMNSSGKWYAEASELRRMADDLEQKK